MMKYKLQVIGSPISHSLSPLIHTSLLEYLGLDYEYEKREVREGELSDFLKYAKENGLCGFNVTMPHKQSVIKYLDEIDEEAVRFNSVNTVKIESGRLLGFNTDAEGYRMSLPQSGEEIRGERIVIIGAGGAASTVALKAAYLGAASVTVLNRNTEKSDLICRSIEEKTSVCARSVSFTYQNLEKECLNAGLVINATPLGMTEIKENFESFDFLKGVKKSATVSDLIYNPYETEFLKNANLLGLNTVNGLGMLIYQGLIADKIFLGRDFDMKSVKQIIEKKYNILQK